MPDIAIDPRGHHFCSCSRNRSIISRPPIRLFGLVEDIGKVAATAVLAVVHGSHEDTGTALGLGALPPETLDLAIAVDLVVLEDS